MVADQLRPGRIWKPHVQESEELSELQGKLSTLQWCHGGKKRLTLADQEGMSQVDILCAYCAYVLEEDNGWVAATEWLDDTGCRRPDTTALTTCIHIPVWRFHFSVAQRRQHGRIWQDTETISPIEAIHNRTRKSHILDRFGLRMTYCSGESRWIYRFAYEIHRSISQEEMTSLTAHRQSHPIHIFSLLFSFSFPWDWTSVMDLPKELTLGNILIRVNLLQLLEVMSSMLSGCETHAADLTWGISPGFLRWVIPTISPRLFWSCYAPST